MSCYWPLRVERSESGELAFSRRVRGPVRDHFQLPCGNCFGCKMERARQWSVRCQHEHKFWDNASFITLTYDDDHLPWHGSLDKPALQKFIKRLRWYFGDGVQRAPDSDKKPIRYFACGEYGDATKRAHYHLLLYNVRFEDRVRYGADTYTSKILSDLWPFGTHLIGDVNPKSTSYVAGYCVKKVRRNFWNQELVEREYGVVNPDTGELHIRPQEFTEMSRRPGVGAYWYQRYASDLKHGYLVRDGEKEPIPAYYKKKFKDDNPFLYEELAYKTHLKHANSDPMEKSEMRQMVKEICARKKKQFFQKETML